MHGHRKTRTRCKPRAPPGQLTLDTLGLVRRQQYKCPHCVLVFAEKRYCTAHVNEQHRDGRKYSCPHCAVKPVARKYERDKHVREVHQNLRTCFCPVCDQAFKRPYDCRKHKRTVHDGVKDFLCMLCAAPFSRKHDLQRHLAHRHEIGPHYCAECQHCTTSQVVHTEPDGTEIPMCQTCFNRKTGKEVRIELRWRAYLNEQLGTAHLLLCDQSLRRFGGDSNLKPDRLSRYAHFVLLEECDEHQHVDARRYKDEEGRMLTILRDPFLGGTNLVVIRWNPHTYAPPAGETCKSRAERLEAHVALVRHLLAHPPTARMTVYYLFYSPDNPQICRSLPHYLLASKADVAALARAPTTDHGEPPA